MSGLGYRRISGFGTRAAQFPPIRNGSEPTQAEIGLEWATGHALTIVQSIAKESPGGYENGSAERLMELQMAYMLLWIAIERYTSLRYHLRKKVMAKIRRMATEPAFHDAFQKYVGEPRDVYSTDIGSPRRLSRDDPAGSLDYYYQVRSNVTHRGKALMVDAILLEKCIHELAPIFCETVEHAFHDCEWRGR